MKNTVNGIKFLDAKGMIIENVKDYLKLWHLLDAARYTIKIRK